MVITLENMQGIVQGTYTSDIIPRKDETIHFQDTNKEYRIFCVTYSIDGMGHTTSVTLKCLVL